MAEEATRHPAATGTRRFGWQQSVGGECLAELMGTLVLVAFGCGSVAMTVAALPLSGRGDVGFASAADWILIALGWGFAVTLGVYVAGGVSGAHLNPAVTLAQAIFRDFEWRKVLPYMAAQLAGAILGGALVYLVYRNAIQALEVTSKLDRGEASGAGSFGIFATSPAPYYHNVVGPLISEITATMFLVGAIFAVTDDVNTPVRGNLAPVVIGLIVVAIALSFGANTGYAINPVRDLGPRIVAWFAGWGSVALPGKTEPVSAYFFVPIIGPLVGGVLGALIYDRGIRRVLLARGATSDPAADERGADVVESS